MYNLGKAFLRGLVAVVPIALTVYLIVTLARWSENTVGDTLRAILPGDLYLPGGGLIVTVALVTLMGYLVNLPIINLPMRLGDAIFSRLPLIKSIYTGIKDIMEFMTSSGEESGQSKAVLVELPGGVQLVGLITDTAPDLDGDGSGKVLVYLPMSYQVGGYTLLIDESALTPLDMSIEKAMRFVLTAGVRKERSPSV